MGNILNFGGIQTELDPSTGEIKRQYIITPLKPKTGLKGGFFLAIQEGFEHISKLDLTGEQYKVLTYIMSQLDFENYICLTQKSVCEALGMKKSNVSRSFKKLVAEGIIHEGPKIAQAKTYRLDPNFGFKGKSKNIKGVVQELDEYRKKKNISATGEDNNQKELENMSKEELIKLIKSQK